jgi:hypothetical protein
MLKHTLAFVAVGFMCSVALGEARVTRIEVLTVEPVPAAQTNGEAEPPYERISGRFYGELDPRDPKNALITDIQHEGYVQAATAAANTLVKRGLLLRHDADTTIAQAQNSDILK